MTSRVPVIITDVRVCCVLSEFASCPAIEVNGTSFHFNLFPAHPEISRPAAAMPATNAEHELTHHQAVLTDQQTWVNYIFTNYSYNNYCQANYSHCKMINYKYNYIIFQSELTKLLLVTILWQGDTSYITEWVCRLAHCM